MPSNGYPIVIQQLGGSRLSVTLDGVFLPDRGIEDGVEHAQVRQRPPGAAEPIVQKLGPDWMPMELRGLFDDGARGELNASYNAHITLQRIAWEGARVSLTWGDTWNREGHLVRYVGRPDHDNRIEWEATFEPVLGEQPTARATVARQMATEADLQAWVVAAKAVADAQRDIQRTIAAASFFRLVTA